jgi:hypothetical protein
MRHALALVVSLALGVLAADPAAAAEGASRTRMDKLEVGCRSQCLHESGDLSYCQAYCGCVRHDVATKHSDEEVDALFAAMHPNSPDTPAKKQLEQLMSGCVAEAHKPSTQPPAQPSRP